VAEPVLVSTAEVTPGRPLLRRYRRGQHNSWLQACRVVANQARGVFLWLPVGAGFGCRLRPDGSAVRAAPIADFGEAQLWIGGWRGRSALIFMPTGLAHSVWWFFDGSVFSGWYVNLEDRSEFWLHDGLLGVDVEDHELDLVVSPERSWQWKDEDDLAAVTGQPGYWDEDKSAKIRAEGLRAVAAIEAAQFPFDGSWCDFSPEPSWQVPVLPHPVPDFRWPMPPG
jgi:Protein of unknown function (DUF402)